MRHLRISLPAVLAITLAAILGATIAVAWNLTRHYEALFYAAKVEQTQRLLDVEIAGKLWHQQFALATATARGIASNPELGRVIQARDAARIRELLADEFHRGAVSSGQLKLDGITIYDAQLQAIAERWQAAPASVPPEVIAAAAERTGLARLSAMQIAWLSEGEPRITVLVAIGLKPAGYIGLHIDPLPALGAIDERIGMMVRISAKTDHRFLYSPNNVHFAPDAVTRENVLRLHGPRGRYLADINVVEDVTALSNALSETRQTWALIAIVFIGGVAAMAGMALHYFLRGVRRREQEDEERFRNYAETASDWFWETGPDHRFTYMSERARAFGVDPDKRIGTSRIVVASDTEAEPDKWQAHIATLERHEPFREFVYKRTLADGLPRYVSVSGTPVFDGKGSFCGYRGTARDVTQRLVREQQLREAKAEAETLRDEALGADRAKSEFLALMSHELRTPLNAIIGFSEILVREVMGPLGAERYREYAADIYNSGQHLLDLINSILDLSKIQARSMALNDEVVDLAGTIASCTRLMSERAREAGIKVITSLRPESLLVRADELRLKQILLNLLSNALKFTPASGTVTISASREPDQSTTIVVADTGIGLTKEEIAVALEPFRQVDNSLARKHQGTGLGLPLTKVLVEMHGGQFLVESVPKQGTTVTMRLPAERSIGTDQVGIAAE